MFELDVKHLRTAMGPLYNRWGCSGAPPPLTWKDFQFISAFIPFHEGTYCLIVRIILPCMLPTVYGDIIIIIITYACILLIYEDICS